MGHPRRHEEAAEIQTADKAAIVGRLMLGELVDLAPFFEVGSRNYETLPRRALRSGKVDVRRRLTAELSAFCERNFEGVGKTALARIYDDVAPLLRLFGVAALPIHRFESSYGRIRDAALRGTPRYGTVVLSVRGLQFRFPEDQLAKDIVAALDLMKAALEAAEINGRSHEDYLARQRTFAARACVSCAFNLLEAFLGGLLWENMDALKVMPLARRDRDMVDDPTSGSLAYKLKHLPELLAGPLPTSAAVDNLLSIAKAFRDSLTHPAPFAAPEKLGGYDKLSHFYAIDVDVAWAVSRDVAAVLELVMKHLSRPIPPWLADVTSALQSKNPSDLHLAFGSRGRV
jgi:hypothetical protein